MRRAAFAVIILVSLLLFSCDIEWCQGEENVNDFIYPYLEFTPDENGEGYVVTVVDGAGLEEIYIPSSVEVDGVSVQITSFGGFENPEDAKNVKIIILESSTTVITDKAAEEATSLIDIEVDTVVPGSVWGELPEVEKEGMEFLGWFIDGTDEEVKSGDPITERNKKISPRWTGHRYVHHDGKEPTCTEKGWYEYDTCEHCDYTTYREIPALGHDISVHHEAVEATCTEGGTRDYWECSRCHRLFSDTDSAHVITETATEAKGHSLHHVDKTEPRCGVKGTESHWECSICHKLFSEDDRDKEVSAADLEIKALEHVWKRTEFSTTATCVWYECELCGETSDAAGHSWNRGETVKKATATESGRKKYTCSVCGTEKYEDTEPLSTEGHAHEWKQLEKIEATCTTRGYTVMECTLCDSTYRCEYRDPTGHRMTEHPEVEATCTAWGSSKYYSCSDCGMLFRDANGINGTTLEEVQKGREPVDHEWNYSVYEKDSTGHWHRCLHCEATTEKTAHSYTEKVTETEYLISDATCISPSVYCCSCVCGRKGTETFSSGEKKPHTAVHHPAVKATCEENGMKEYWSCSGECGQNFADSACTVVIEDISTYVIKATGHRDSGLFTSAGNDGHQKKCSVCGQGYGDVLPHDIQNDEWTGTDEQYHWHKCSECEVMADREAHSFITIGEDEVCEVCFYIKEKGQKAQDGSFEIQAGSSEPEGTLAVTGEKGSFRATFTLDSKSAMTRVEWHVDDVIRKTVTEFSGTKVIFDFNAPDYRTYTVTCVVFNGDIVSSFDRQVFGGGST